LRGCFSSVLCACAVFLLREQQSFCKTKKTMKSSAETSFSVAGFVSPPPCLNVRLLPGQRLAVLGQHRGHLPDGHHAPVPNARRPPSRRRGVAAVAGVEPPQRPHAKRRARPSGR
jgi:hypothetical protein